MAKRIHKAFCSLTGKSDKKRLDKQAVPEGVFTQEYAYINDGNECHTLNVYHAEGVDPNAPVLIDIHGGGWVYGDKDLNRNYDKVLAKKGFTVIAPSYRLAGDEYDYVDQIKDIFAFFNWILVTAEDLHFNTDNIFLTGDSAGAHLATLAINCLLSEEAREIFNVHSDIKINAVTLTCGAFNPTSMAKIPVVRSFMKGIIGKGFKKSPYYKYVDIKATLPDSYIPARFITADGDFLKKMVFSTYHLFKEKGFDVELAHIPFKQQKHPLGHVYNILQPYYEESEQTNEDTANFFKKHIQD